MEQKVDAIYENGVLQPLQHLDLQDRERVCIIVEPVRVDDWIDEEAMSWAAREGNDAISLDDVRKRLAKIDGALSEVVIAQRGEY